MPTVAAKSQRPEIDASHLLRAFLDNIPDAVYFKDRDSRFLVVSAALAAKHGLASPDDLVGKTDFDVFAESHARPAYEDEQTIIATGQPIKNKLEHEVQPDGGESWCVSSKLPLRDASGAIIGTFGISRDVTVARQLQEQLETSHKDLMDASRRAGMADIATGVLHNIGNVLNSVNVASEQIAEGLRKSRIDGVVKLADLFAAQSADLPAFFATPRGQQVTGYLAGLSGHLVLERDRLLSELAGLRRSIDHIKDIVAVQQSFACSASGLVEPLDLVSLIEESVRLNTSSLERHDIRIVREFAPAPCVLADRTRVLQILVNLVRNAKHALDDGAPAEKRLTLRIAPAGPGRVRLTVADNGIGIPPENLDRIFAHGFTTRKKGHGFGLHSSALSAVELDGSLTVHSDGPGRGAAFTLELPAAPEGSLSSPAPEGACNDAGALLTRDAGR